MTIFLHHYPASSFAEKVRVLLGYLKLEWQSVQIEPIAPRPDLDLLTGGYRRTPVLQIDSNIYCDTHLIARTLADHAFDETLFAHGFVAERIAEWADHQLIDVCRTLNMRPEAISDTIERIAPGKVAAFKKDRAALFKGSSKQKLSPETALGFLTTYLNQLNNWLDNAFIFGKAPSIADFSVYHCLWSLAQSPLNSALLYPYANVCDWMERVHAFGHGLYEDSDAQEAIDHAFDTFPELPFVTTLLLPGLQIGDYVKVTPVDYGCVAVVGELLAMSADQIIVGRETDETGGVICHFPISGYEIRKLEEN